MPGIGKHQVIRGSGNPLIARETLLAAMLLELGFPLFQSEEQKNFQDVTLEHDKTNRRFVYVFASVVVDVGGVKVDAQTVIQQLIGLADVSDFLRGRAETYLAFTPSNKPLESFKVADRLEDSGRLKLTYVKLLESIRAMPRHLELHRGSRKYWLPMDLSPEEIEAKILEIA